MTVIAWLLLVYWLAVFVLRVTWAVVVLPIDPHLQDECPEEGPAEQAILRTVMANYTKQILPIKNGLVAQVEMHINDIPSLSELDSEFSLDLMYSEMWTDRRLAYSNLSQGRCIRNITLDLDYLDKLWSPNTCIVNSKSAVIHNSPSENVFLILYEDGRVWKNCRMMVRAPCTIDLRAFPFDKQKCVMVFESYSYNSQRVSLQWFPQPITLLKKMDLPDFTLIDYSAERDTVEYPNGLWDQLKATFVFKRRYGFFILQAYVPTYMTIFVAWINFWMDPKELSTRATLSISAFLAITLQFGNILKNQPPVSYVKALDVWMLGCIIFLFTALAELAIVSYMQRSDKPTKLLRTSTTSKKKTAKNIAKGKSNGLWKRRNRQYCDRSCESPDRAAPPTVTNAEVIVTSTDTPRRKVMFYEQITPFHVDWACLVVFPPVFIAFNIFYWCYFVGIDNI